MDARFFFWKHCCRAVFKKKKINFSFSFNFKFFKFIEHKKNSKLDHCGQNLVGRKKCKLLDIIIVFDNILFEEGFEVFLMNIYLFTQNVILINYIIIQSLE